MDVAIGAPYEDKGVIYIFLGTANGLMNEPAQVSCGCHSIKRLQSVKCCNMLVSTTLTDTEARL